MAVTSDEWVHADSLNEDLDAIDLPEALRRQISFRDTSVPDLQRGPGFVQYPPPWPGCCTPPGMGCSRIWGEFCLSEWIDLAPWAFGPGETPEWAAVLDAASAKLRDAGEGSRTMFALDLLHPGEQGWLTHPVTAFAVSDLVQWGPPLTRPLIASIDAMIGTPNASGERWGRVTAEPNAETTYHGVRCYETTWAACCG